MNGPMDLPGRKILPGNPKAVSSCGFVSITDNMKQNFSIPFCAQEC